MTSLPASIDCSDDCTARFETGLIVVLSAAADGDSIFTGWSGDCHGTAPCILTLDTDRSVAAQFETLKEGLQVAKTGTGSGRVRSSPLGIDCGAVCVAGFPPGSTITLQAWPDASSTFAGWAGLCQGAEVCTFSLSAAGSVTAAFELIQYSLSVDKTGSGSGTVKATPAGIASAHSCAAIYPAGVLVTLEAKPDETSMFTGWSGACSGTGACTVTMDAAKSVSANFEVLRRRLSLVTTGSGLVTSIPSGISCGNVCAADFVIGSYVVLQARPQSGSSFAGWSGPCAGSETCTVIMDADRSLTASFR